MIRVAHAGGNPIERIDRDWEAMAEAQIVTTRCAYCDWLKTGPLAETRKAHAGHRLDAHGIGPLRHKVQKCAKHDCVRLTRSASGMCPEHAEDAMGNARRRKPNNHRPKMGPSIAALVANRFERGFNREDLPVWR